MKEGDLTKFAFIEKYQEKLPYMGSLESRLIIKYEKFRFDFFFNRGILTADDVFWAVDAGHITQK